MQVLEGHTILSQRPNARTFVLLRENKAFRWQGDARLHRTQADAYDAMGLPPSQAPLELSPQENPNDAAGQCSLLP